MAKTKTKKRIPGTVANTKTNPFLIEEGVDINVHRVSRVNVDLLIGQLLKLPVDKNTSILIPGTVISNKGEVGNLLLTARRAIKMDKRFPKDYTIAARNFLNAAGKFTHARVWRIA